MTERSAGFMIFRRVNSQIEYLLMKASEFEQNWSSPKGFVFFYTIHLLQLNSSINFDILVSFHRSC